MIGTRTPFRFSFVGGGTDLPSFYNERPGHVISATINKYMYIFLHPHFEEKFLIKYSVTEFVDRVEEIRHPIVRHALQRFDFRGLDINSIADIPAGTGLASSSAFTVGLLHALYAQAGKFVSKGQLAAEAAHIEIEELKEPIGKQDQYAAAFGGLNRITFLPDETVKVEQVHLSHKALKEFRSYLLVFYTGGTRNAREVLTDQIKHSATAGDKRDFLCDMADMVDPFQQCLLKGDYVACGRIMEEGWSLKRKLSDLIANDTIDKFHRLAIDNGATGGKVLGAGGGGFLLFVAPPDAHAGLKKALGELKCLDFEFDFSGSSIVTFDVS